MRAIASIREEDLVHADVYTAEQIALSEQSLSSERYEPARFARRLAVLRAAL